MEAQTRTVCSKELSVDMLVDQSPAMGQDAGVGNDELKDVIFEDLSCLHSTKRAYQRQCSSTGCNE